MLKKSYSATAHFFKELITDIFNVTFMLFKIMIPMLIIIKIVEELGGIVLLSLLLNPLMEMVGLPDSMGLVWATTLLTNIYGGLIVLAGTDTFPPHFVSVIYIAM